MSVALEFQLQFYKRFISYLAKVKVLAGISMYISYS